MDGRSELQCFLTSWQCSGSLTSLSMLGYVVVKWATREASWAKERSTSAGTFEDSELAGGFSPLVVAIDELGAIVASAQAKKKQADHFAYSDNSKRSLKWRYSCSCFAVHSVDTIPKCSRSQLSTKILLGSAPAELVRNGFQT